MNFFDMQKKNSFSYYQYYTFNHYIIYQAILDYDTYFHIGYFRVIHDPS